MPPPKSVFEPRTFSTGRPEDDPLLTRAHMQLTAFYRYRNEVVKYRGEDPDPIKNKVLERARQAKTMIFERYAVARWHNEQKKLLKGDRLDTLAHSDFPSMSFEQAEVIIFQLVEEHRHEMAKRNLISCRNALRLASEAALQNAKDVKETFAVVQKERNLADDEMWDQMLLDLDKCVSDTKQAHEAAVSVLISCSGEADS